jgi:hypothetical protein
VLEPFAWAYALVIIVERDKLGLRLREAHREAFEAVQPQREKLEMICDDIAEYEKEAGQIAGAIGAIPKEAQATSVVFRQLQLQASELDTRTHHRRRTATCCKPK